LSGRVILALGLVVAAALGVGAGLAGSAADPPAEIPTTASAVAIRVLAPGAAASGTLLVSAPPVGTPLATGAFAYPADGSVVTATSTNASASADTAGTSTSSVTGLVLFGGEITADSVLARANAVSTATTADGNFDGTLTQNLVALGTPVTANQTALADWGTLTLNVLNVQRSNEKVAHYSGSVAAIDIRLNLDHGGLPAGTEIQIGYAEVLAASVPPVAPQPETQATTTTTTTTAAATTTAATTTAATTTEKVTTTPKPATKPSKPKPET